MRIWFQLMASETRSAGFLSAVKEQLDGVAREGTVVNVRGTTQGAYADQYRAFFQFDEREILENGVIAQREGYDAYVVANSLDPAIVALRELLDIPVLAMMEVSTFVACMTGEKFGIVGTNDKYSARYREMIAGYGLERRLVGVDSVRFHLRDIHRAFADAELAESVMKAYTDCARRLIAQGADVLIAAGVHTTIAASSGLRTVDGAIVQDSYALLLRFAEAAADTHRATGVWTAKRGLYEPPPLETIEEGGKIYGVPWLADWRDRLPE